MAAATTWLRQLPQHRARLAGVALTIVYVAYSASKAQDLSILFQFTVIGVCEGAIFAIAAGGLVLTYATTGVFNFAHGAVGMIAAYLYWWLTVERGLPVPLALVLVLFVFAPLLGLFLELVMRFFKDTPIQTNVVVTIALTVMLIGVAQQAFNGTANLPRLIEGQLDFLGSSPTKDNVLAVVVAIAVAIGLRLLLFRSRTGTAMRAVVDNPDLAALNGAPAKTIARYSWMLGSVLAALAGILLASGGPLEAITLTFFVAGAYGAAVVGKLKSLPLTFAGALALGIIKQWAEFNFPDGTVWTSVKTAIPAIFLFAALLLVPAAKLSVGRVVGRRPPRVPTLRVSAASSAAFVGAVLVVSRIVPDGRITDVTRGLVYALLVLSLVLLTGFSGQVSLCQYVFLAMGAWAMGNAFNGDNPLGLLLAGLVAVPLGVVIALPALRLTGLYLALVTFSFAFAARYVLFDNPRVYGTANVEVGRPKILGVDFGGNRAFLVLCGLIFALFALVVLALKRGPFGRRLAALRDSQAACATLGLDVRRTKLVVFAASAFIAGVAGALFGGLSQTAGTIQFDPINNIVLFLFAMVGGVTTVTGALFGGALFALLPFIQSEYPDFQGLAFAVVAFGAIALGRQPNGLAGLLWDRLRPSRPARTRRPAATPATPATTGPAATASTEVVAGAHA